MSGRRLQSRFERSSPRIRLRMMLFEPTTRILIAILLLTWAGFSVFMLLASGKGNQLAHWIASL